MAKVPFSKFKAKTCVDTKKVSFNEIDFEVRQYVPIEEKMALVGNVINNSVDEHNYYNPMRIDVYLVLEVMFTYTNLTFTDKQKEDLPKLYDVMVSSGLWAKVLDALPEDDFVDLSIYVDEVIDSIYEYKNSMMGILDQIGENYSNLDVEATDIQKKLADPNNLKLLKDVMTKMG